MAITSVGYDGTVDETQFARLIGYSAHSSYGVNSPDSFKASTVAGQVLQVKISSWGGNAAAWTSGLIDLMDADETVQFESPSSGTRWDMIVLRRDYQPPGGTTTLEVIKGGSRKTLPSMEGDIGVLADQPLWLVRVDAGNTTPVEYVDLRVWARNGGCTAKDDLVRSYMRISGTMIEINGTVWLYRVNQNNVNEWVKLVAPDVDPGWFKSSPSMGWGGPDSYIYRRRRNGLVEIRGRVDRIASWDQYIPSNGDIGNRVIGRLPREYWPTGPSISLASGAIGPTASYSIGTNGEISLTAVDSGTKIGGGFQSTFSGMYFVD